MLLKETLTKDDRDRNKVEQRGENSEGNVRWSKPDLRFNEIEYDQKINKLCTIELI